MNQQEKEIKESFELYQEASSLRDENAKSFCINKTEDELKVWLADQPVAYNLWRDASYDTLVGLVFNVYDE